MDFFKVHFENRFIIISPEPDRLQKYGLFHKFNDTDELYRLISEFQEDKSILSVNIYGTDIKHLWRIFRIYFTEVGAAGGLVKHTGGRYLFIERKGKWDLPRPYRTWRVTRGLRIERGKGGDRNYRPFNCETT